MAVLLMSREKSTYTQLHIQHTAKNLPPFDSKNPILRPEVLHAFGHLNAQHTYYQTNQKCDQLRTSAL